MQAYPSAAVKGTTQQVTGAMCSRCKTACTDEACRAAILTAPNVKSLKKLQHSTPQSDMQTVLERRESLLPAQVKLPVTIKPQDHWGLMEGILTKGCCTQGPPKPKGLCIKTWIDTIRYGPRGVELMEFSREI